MYKSPVYLIPIGENAASHTHHSSCSSRDVITMSVD
jgi:hypothetical protein